MVLTKYEFDMDNTSEVLSFMWIRNDIDCLYLEIRKHIKLGILNRIEFQIKVSTLVIFWLIYMKVETKNKGLTVTVELSPAFTKNHYNTCFYFYALVWTDFNINECILRWGSNVVVFGCIVIIQVQSFSIHETKDMQLFSTPNLSTNIWYVLSVLINTTAGWLAFQQ